MQIDIRSDPLSLTDALHGYAERRLRFVLSDTPRLVRVSLLLKAANDTPGGVGTCCRIRVVLRGGGTVIVEEAQADAYTAVDRASERVARTLYRIAQRDERRRPGSRAARHLAQH